MIGYLKPRRGDMTPECREVYQGVYCGLCRGLKKRYGLRGIACLNYELTGFLTVVLALREEEVPLYHGCCAISPVLHVPYVDYLDDAVLSAADVSVAVAGLEIEDNVTDEGTMKWKLARWILRSRVEKARQRLEGAFTRMEDSAQVYYTLERSPEAEATELLEACGAVIVSVLEPVIALCPEDQQPGLRRLADTLGRWICLADACDDAAEDQETGRPNLLDNLSDLRFVGNMLSSLQEEITSCLETLPIRRFRDVIDRVLGTDLRRTGQRVLKKYESGVYPNGSGI